MSQISPPLRILLVGAVIFMAAWMTVLKPKDPAVEPAPAPAPAPNVKTSAPAVSKPGKAVEAAQNAANSASAAAAARAGEAPATAAPATSAPATAAAAPAKAGKPVVAQAPKPAAETAGLPAVVAKAIAQKKVLVMLFWNSQAPDDRAVRRELRAVNKHKGAVKIHLASIKDVARYAPITRGVDLNQSPTVVVVDRKLQAASLVGYNDRGLINQAVSDALRAR